MSNRVVKEAARLGIVTGTSLLMQRFTKSPADIELEAAERYAELANRLPHSDTDVDKDFVETDQDELEAAVDALTQYRKALDVAAGKEECGMCRQLLDTLRQQPLDVQLKALPELAVLKKEIEDGADEERLKDMWTELDTLRNLLEDSLDE